MAKQRKGNIKYSQSKLRECCEWITQYGLRDYGGASIKTYCEAMGISTDTHSVWLKKYPEYSNIVESAKDNFRASQSPKLINSLFEAAKGREYKEMETTTEYIPSDKGSEDKPKIRRMVKKERTIFIKPDIGAAIFLLTNLDPEHWQNKMRNDVAIKKPNSNEDMSLDEIKEEIKRLTEG